MSVGGSGAVGRGVRAGGGANLGRVERATESALRRMPELVRADARAWFYALEGEDKSPNTTLGYLTALLKFAQFLEPKDDDPPGRVVTSLGEVTHRHVQEFLSSVRKGTNSTAVTWYIALGVFFKWAVRDGVVSADPMVKVSRPASRKPVTEIPAVTDVRAMLAVCVGGRNEFTPARDRAIIRLFADVGLRRAELGGLTLEDVDLDERTVHVVGKGRKDRVAVISPKTRKALFDYLRVRAEHPHADSPMLWLGAQGRPAINADALWQIITRRAAQAGVRAHPHMFRHLTADGLLEDGVPEGAVMVMLGWSDRRMLDRYGAHNAEKRAKDMQRQRRHGDRF